MSAQGPPGAAMEKIAARLGRRARGRKTFACAARALPHLWFLTDPARTPDPASIAARLPRGAAVIYRAFGARDRVEIAKTLRRVTRERGLVLLIGADWRLAALVGADGVHLPQRLIRRAGDLRRRRPDWLLTAAAHDAAAVTGQARRALDALIISAVFPSRSPSAGRALGAIRFAALVRRAGLPVIALGGVNDANSARLASSAAAGLAGIDGFSRYKLKIS